MVWPLSWVNNQLNLNFVIHRFTEVKIPYKLIVKTKRHNSNFHTFNISKQRGNKLA